MLFKIWKTSLHQLLSHADEIDKYQQYYHQLLKCEWNFHARLNIWNEIFLKLKGRGTKVEMKMSKKFETLPGGAGDSNVRRKNKSIDRTPMGPCTPLRETQRSYWVLISFLKIWLEDLIFNNTYIPNYYVIDLYIITYTYIYLLNI